MPVICDSDASIEQAGGVLGNGLCGGGTLFNFIADALQGSRFAQSQARKKEKEEMSEENKGAKSAGSEDIGGRSDSARVLKPALLDAVSCRVPASQSVIKRTIAAFLDELAKAVNGGRSVVFPGFGRFYPRKIAEMRRFVPWVGDFVTIPEHFVFGFAPSDCIKRIKAPQVVSDLEAAEASE